MANILGELFVQLNLNTAGFSEGLNKVSSDAKKAGQELSNFGERSNYSMMEARHGVMLLGEEFGVHIPRAVSTLVASIGPIGEIMAAAFPILGAIALVEIMEKVADHFDKIKEESAKFAVEEQNVKDKVNLTAAGLELENNKLEDEIAKLSKAGLAHHTLRDAMLETGIAAGKLAEGLEKTNESVEKISKSTGFLENMKESILHLGNSVNKLDIGKVDVAAAKAAQSIKLVEAAKDEMDAHVGDPSYIEKFKQALEDSNRELTHSIQTTQTFGSTMSATPAKIDIWTKAIIDQDSALTLLADHAKKASLEMEKSSIEGANKTIEGFKKLDADMAKLEKDWIAMGNEQKKFHDELVKSNVADQAFNYKQLDDEIKNTSKDTDAYLKSFKTLADAQSKLGVDQQIAAFKAQEDVIKKNAADRVITQQKANAQLKALYVQEEAVAVSADNKKLAALKSNIEEYQRAVLAAEKTGDLEQLNALRTLLNQELAAYADTEDKILKIKEQYGAKQNVEDVKTSNENEKIVQGMIGKVTTQFADMVATGKMNFKSLFDSLEADILKTLMSKALNDLIGKLTGSLFGSGGEEGGGGGGAGGGGILSFGGLFGGGKAVGGSVSPGIAYLVGEKGQEMFVPHTPGTIVPNSASIPSSPFHAHVNIHVHGASDPDTFRRATPQIMADVYRHLQTAHTHAGR